MKQLTEDQRKRKIATKKRLLDNKYSGLSRQIQKDEEQLKVFQDTLNDWNNYKGIASKEEYEWAINSVQERLKSLKSLE